MVRATGQPQVRLKDHYQRILGDITREHDIEVPRRPDHLVSSNARRAHVIRHTMWYVGGLADTRHHYRYRRYLEVLTRVALVEERIAHVDLGCGAGLFSWVLLDWAIDHGIEDSHVDLYGMDHNLAMIELANEVREQLLRYRPEYPELRYESDVDDLCTHLTANHREDTKYIVTLGHVLVQAQTRDAIQNFTQAIAHVMGLVGPAENCALIAIDADGGRDALAAGWAALLDSLDGEDVLSEEVRIQTTGINDNGRAKMALLTHGQ